MANDRRDPRYDYGGYKARGEIEAALSGVNTAADAFARAYGVATQIKDRRDAKKLAQAAAIPGMAALAAERYGSPRLAGYPSTGGSKRGPSGYAAGLSSPVTTSEGAEAEWAAKLAARDAAREELQLAEQEKEALQRAVGLLGAAALEAPPVEEFDLLEAARTGKLGWDRLPETREITPEYERSVRNDAARLEEALTGKLGWSSLPETREITPEYVASILEGTDTVAVRDPEAAPPMPSGASRGLSPGPLDGAVEEITVREEQVELVASEPKPGEAADPRPDAPRGLLAQAEEALGENRKNISALYKKLDELDSSSAGYINPFQKFGRDVGYTPSLRAVAEGVMRAENGDFRLINMVAGRSVGRHELSGLYAEYREFISGAEKKASEIGEERRRTALGEKATAAAKQQQKQMGIITDELVRYGWKPEHAKAVAAGVVSSYSDPDDVAKYMERARKFTEAQQKRAADEANARRKAKGSGTGGVRAGGDPKLLASYNTLYDNWTAARGKHTSLLSYGEAISPEKVADSERIVAQARNDALEARRLWRASAGDVPSTKLTPVERLIEANRAHTKKNTADEFFGFIKASGKYTEDDILLATYALYPNWSGPKEDTPEKTIESLEAKIAGINVASLDEEREAEGLRRELAGLQGRAQDEPLRKEIRESILGAQKLIKSGKEFRGGSADDWERAKGRLEVVLADIQKRRSEHHTPGRRGFGPVLQADAPRITDRPFAEDIYEIRLLLKRLDEIQYTLNVPL